MISSFIKFILGFAVIVVIAGFLRTLQLGFSAKDKVFEGGTVPSPAPDGFYNGSVDLKDTSWLGKKFDSANSIGINVFKRADGTSEEHSAFKTYETYASHDSVKVLAIDYDIPGNPWWLRLILDEIVQTAPDSYLGKLQIRLVPGYPFTLAFFELKK